MDSAEQPPESLDEMLVLFEPALGEVRPGEEVRIDISVSSSKAGRFMRKLACHIDCLPGNPLWLHLESEFEVGFMFFYLDLVELVLCCKKSHKSSPSVRLLKKGTRHLAY